MKFSLSLWALVCHALFSSLCYCATMKEKTTTTTTTTTTASNCAA
jgi:hypothetical protein